MCRELTFLQYCFFSLKNMVFSHLFGPSLCIFIILCIFIMFFMEVLNVFVVVVKGTFHSVPKFSLLFQIKIFSILYCELQNHFIQSSKELLLACCVKLHQILNNFKALASLYSSFYPRIQFVQLFFCDLIKLLFKIFSDILKWICLMLKEETRLTFISNLHCLFPGSLCIGATLRGVCRIPQFLSGTGKISPFYIYFRRGSETYKQYYLIISLFRIMSNPE